MPKALRGAVYTVATKITDGVILTQTEPDIDFLTFDQENGHNLTLVLPVGQVPQNPLYFDLVVFGQVQTKGIFVPKGQNRTLVAKALRARFGPKTRLHFQGFPRDCDVTMVAAALPVQT
ncbi:MAG: hypothetical protein WCT39_06835 [Candidatus Margulisiibacteriota bacterium]